MYSIIDISLVSFNGTVRMYSCRRQYAAAVIVSNPLTVASLHKRLFQETLVPPSIA
jgi:hypothetical protein